MRLSILLTPLLFLFVTKIWLTKADHPNVIKPVDRNVLTELHAVFQPIFNRERTFPHQRQYAVLYYGSPNLQASIRFRQCERQTGGAVFINGPHLGFCIRQCNFIAGRQIAPGGLHTEAMILQSIPNVCPSSQTPNGNMYLFTFNSPCTECDAIIRLFVQRCGHRFKRLIIGYAQPFRDVVQSEQIIRATPQAAMTQI
jgi:hypothetical protein